MAKRWVVPNIIASDFPFFRLRMTLFSFIYSANKFKSSDNCDSIISMLLPARYNTVSSAYLVMFEFPRTSTISFAKNIDNKGPKMNPCGTPQVSKLDSDKVFGVRNWLSVCG